MCIVWCSYLSGVKARFFHGGSLFQPCFSVSRVVLCFEIYSWVGLPQPCFLTFTLGEEKLSIPYINWNCYVDMLSGLCHSWTSLAFTLLCRDGQVAVSISTSHILGLVQRVTGGGWWCSIACTSHLSWRGFCLHHLLGALSCSHIFFPGLIL